MSTSLGPGRFVSLAALALWFAACSFDSDLSVKSGNAAPASSGVTLSGAGAENDAAAALGYGEGSKISEIDGSIVSRRAPADDPHTGNADALEPAGRAGGVASTTGDAAGAGEGGTGSRANDGTASNPKQPPVLWFSEYIEGSSSNKALEITAPGRTVLDGCKVTTYFNGKTEATVVAVLSGVLEAGQVLTLCTSSLKDKLAAACAQVGNLTFNGNDAVALDCDGEVVDVIGQIGVDPGDAWGNDPNRTADHTLRRKCSVQNGDSLGTDAFEPDAQWLAFPIDTFDGLGSRGC